MHTITPTTVITMTIAMVAAATGKTMMSSSESLLINSLTSPVPAGGHPVLNIGPDVVVVESVINGVGSDCSGCSGLTTIPVV